MAEILIQRRRQRNIWPWLLGLLALALLPLPFLAADRDERAGEPARTARRDTTGRADTARADTTPRSDVAAQGASSGVAAAPGRPPGRTTATAGGAVAPGSPPAAASPPSVERIPGAPPTGGDRSTAATPSAAPTTPGTNTFAGFIAARGANLSEGEHREYTSDALRRLADELRALGASNAGVRAIRANADSVRMTGRRREAHPDHARAAFLAAVYELDVLRGRYRAAVDTGGLRAAAWAIRPAQSLHRQRDVVQRFLESARDALQAISRSATSRRGR